MLLESQGAAHAARTPPRAAPSQKTRIQVWLYENTDLRIEGKIIGFDEYMNLVVRKARRAPGLVGLLSALAT